MMIVAYNIWLNFHDINSINLHGLDPFQPFPFLSYSCLPFVCACACFIKCVRVCSFTWWMSSCVCACVYVRVCVCLRACVRVYLRISCDPRRHNPPRVRVRVYVRVFTCVYTCAYVRVGVLTFVHNVIHAVRINRRSPPRGVCVYVRVRVFPCVCPCVYVRACLPSYFM